MSLGWVDPIKMECSYPQTRFKGGLFGIFRYPFWSSHHAIIIQQRICSFQVVWWLHAKCVSFQINLDRSSSSKALVCRSTANPARSVISAQWRVNNTQEWSTESWFLRYSNVFFRCYYFWRELDFLKTQFWTRPDAFSKRETSSLMVLPHPSHRNVCG